jgi:ABC-2 type transport system permease protein
MAREWERGTLESQMATPVTIQELLLGKLVPYYVLGMLSMILCVTIATVLYDVPFRGSFLALALVTTAFLFAALGLGLLVSVVSRNQVIAAQISMLLGFLPAFMLSGFIFEIASMPFVIQLFTYILPARYFVSCLQTLFLVGNVWELILFNTAVMLFIGLILHAITAHITVKRLD